MAEIDVSAKIENLEDVISLLDTELDKTSCSMGLRMKLQVALEEIYVNIANYAYENENADGKGRVRVDIKMDSNNVIHIKLTDDGKKFDPLSKADPDTTLDASERQIGGLGIYMVKKSMDSVEYKYENGQNCFSMSKKID